MKGNLSGLLQQAQKMQQDMQRAQEELAQLEVTGQAGAGMVEVTMTGRHAVKRVRIDSSVADDLEMLEDLVAAAVNDAVNRANEAAEKKMSGMAQGLPLPPGMKLPF